MTPSTCALAAPRTRRRGAPRAPRAARWCSWRVTALHGVRERLAQRPVRGLVLAEAVLLRKPFDLDRDGHQIVSAKRRFRGAEDRRDRRGTAAHATATPTATWPGSGWAGVEHGPAPAGDHGGHRVEREDPLPLLRDLVDGEHHAGEKRQDLEEHRDHVANVAVADVDGGEQQADAEHRHDGEQDKERRSQRLPAGRPRVVLPDEKDEHGQADDEVDERHAHCRRAGAASAGSTPSSRAGGSRASSRLARLRADAKYCIGSTPATTRLGYGVSPAGKFANLPKTIT